MQGISEVNGARLAYELAGTGQPLILVHASIADRRMWDGQFAVFAKHYRVARYDQRGFGESDYPAAAFSPMEDLAGLLRALDLGGAAVIGISMGGRAAVELALAHPELVSALVAVATGPGGWRPPDELRADFSPMDAAFAARDIARQIEEDLRMWVDGPTRTPEQVDPQVREGVRHMDARAYEIQWQGGEPIEAEERWLDPPAVGRLGEIQVPTLVIAGALDNPGTNAGTEALSQGIPGAQRVELAGTAHLPPVERPEEFNRVVLDFLKGALG
jgi:pimeloyl-ACP methyl ester carboxylesterase